MRLAPGGSRARPAFPSRPSRHRPASLSSKGGDRPLTRAGARRPAGAHCPRLPSAPLTRAGGKQRIACLSTRSLPAMPPRPCRRCIPVAIARILRGAASFAGRCKRRRTPRQRSLSASPAPAPRPSAAAGADPSRAPASLPCGRPARRAPFSTSVVPPLPAPPRSGAGQPPPPGPAPGPRSPGDFAHGPPQGPARALTGGSSPSSWPLRAPPCPCRKGRVGRASGSRRRSRR